MSNEPATAASGQDIPPAKLRQVVAASSAGTIFEWYDFFVYAALASVLAPHFFGGLPDAQAFVFTLLTFALGFLTRPLGALVFGKIGDSSGRKGAFLITITLMGVATFAIGLLPDVNQIGIWAPILLVVCRVLQGFALGGEYGGAAIYVAEHAPHHRRGGATGWIQTSAAFGLLGALVVVLITRISLGEESFRDWGWRIPFLVSIGLLAISVWIRLQLEESPAFQKLKEEGRLSKRAYHESFFEWRNAKIVLLALFGIMMAQGVVWYTASFYTQFYLERTLKVDSQTVNLLMVATVLLSAPLYLFFARLSDFVGRKPVMLGGMLLMLVLYFPGYDFITRSANPALYEATRTTPVTVIADPADCTFQLDLTGGARQFSTSCDIAKGALASAGVSYATEAGPAGALARIRIGNREIESVSAEGANAAELRDIRAQFTNRLHRALGAAGFPVVVSTSAANPALAAASAAHPATVSADFSQCTFQFDPPSSATTPCDSARSVLMRAGLHFTTNHAPASAPVRITIGEQEIVADDSTGEALVGRLEAALQAAGFPLSELSAEDRARIVDTALIAAPGAMQGWSLSEIIRVFSDKIGVFAIMALFVVAATALYGPQAAALVELFPTRIRYTAMSLPYHIGTGWFGGLLPAIVFAINTATGQINAGLWFPFVVTAIAATVCFLFLPETKDRDIHA